jgi:hypothetical protein
MPHIRIITDRKGEIDLSLIAKLNPAEKPCPVCFNIGFRQEKNSYICQECGAEFSPQQFLNFSYNIKDFEAVVIDTNFGKNSRHLVLDHHFTEQDKPDVTATITVINFIKGLKKGNKTLSNLNDYLERAVLMRIKDKNLLGNKKNLKRPYYFLVVNHIDIDSILAILAYENPSFALKNEGTLKNLSRFADTFDRNIINKHPYIKELYLLLDGFIKEKIELNKKSKLKLLDEILREIPGIISNPGRYKIYLDKALVAFNTSKSLIEKEQDCFKKHNKHILLYNCLEKSSKIDALYEWIFEKKDIFLLNNINILDIPIIFKQNKEKKKFCISLNPYYENYASLSLYPLKIILEKYEIYIVEHLLIPFNLRDEFNEVIKEIISKIVNFKDFSGQKIPLYSTIKNKIGYFKESYKDEKIIKDTLNEINNMVSLIGKNLSSLIEESSLKRYINYLSEITEKIIANYKGSGITAINQNEEKDLKRFEKDLELFIKNKDAEIQKIIENISSMIDSERGVNFKKIKKETGKIGLIINEIRDKIVNDIKPFSPIEKYLVVMKNLYGAEKINKQFLQNHLKNIKSGKVWYGRSSLIKNHESLIYPELALEIIENNIKAIGIKKNYLNSLAKITRFLTG